MVYAKVEKCKKCKIWMYAKTKNAQKIIIRGKCKSANNYLCQKSLKIFQFCRSAIKSKKCEKSDNFSHFCIKLREIMIISRIFALKISGNRYNFLHFCMPNYPWKLAIPNKWENVINAKIELCKIIQLFFRFDNCHFSQLIAWKKYA